MLFRSYDGLSEISARTEAEKTVEYLINKGISKDKIFYDSQSLETLGSFTFPRVNPTKGNPKLTDFERILVVGQDQRMDEIKKCAGIVFSEYSQRKRLDFHEVPGNQNNKVISKIYNYGFMNALESNQPTYCGAEKAHEFLIKNHPFYSKGWYDKSSSRRKIEAVLIGLSWYFRR